jgi:MSHA biogenesis protein MshJ
MSIAQRLHQTIQGVLARLQPLAERIDRLSLRERALIFGSINIVIYIAWQALLMDPLNARALRAAQQINELNERVALALPGGTAADGDPAILAMTRERALRERRVALQADLAAAARGYVPPERMSDLLQQLLERQHGLRLVSLQNLPVESLSPHKDASDAVDHGPFLHPVEMELEGDYGSVVAYLQSLEQLPWRLHWREVDVATQKYPNNRIRIEIGTLSLSRNWMSI